MLPYRFLQDFIIIRGKTRSFCGYPQNVCVIFIVIKMLKNMLLRVYNKHYLGIIWANKTLNSKWV